MYDSYEEVLVVRKTGKVLKMALYGLCVLFVLCVWGFFLTGYFILLPVAVILGVGIYFSGQEQHVEYEYLYVSRELSVDKIIAKKKRKKAGVYSLDKMEYFARADSEKLRSFKDKSMKKKDYTSRTGDKPIYEMIINTSDGRICLMLEPGEEMYKAISMVFPSKVDREIR